MKTKLKSVAALACAGMCALSFTTACGSDEIVGKSALLSAPKAVEKVGYYELNANDYKDFKKAVEAFAADFAAYSYADYKKQDNFTVSPISVYMALSLAAECASGDTRKEILGALGVTHEQLKTHYSTLYRSLEVEHTYYDEITGLLDLTNSIWVNDGTTVKQACINSLADDYYAYSYSADFAHNNGEANKAVRDFVNEQSKGLIDKDFGLSTETLFALINTVYLKTIWNDSGRDLTLTVDNYDFTAKDGSVKKTKLLSSYYHGGRAVEFDTFTTFYTSTFDGYQIKFILPKDGYSVDQVFSAENIAEVNSITNYGSYDEEENVRYLTRALFPEYKCKYDEDIVDVLQNKFDIDSLFDPYTCDFSTLSDKPCYCSQIRHVTDLTVNRKGVEGAAVTVIEMNGDADSDGPSKPIKIIYEDFIVDKAFGFILTDMHNTTLFSGVVNNI